MSFSQLTKMTAFSTGANLWVLPDTVNSQWSRRIDWHLGFLITRAQHHKKIEMGTGLKEILTHCQIENQDFTQSDNAPLLVSSQTHLPNQMTVCIQYSKAKDWIQKAALIWKNLNYPSLRIFLPEGISPEDLMKDWPNPGFNSEISLVSHG